MTDAPKAPVPYNSSSFAGVDQEKENWRDAGLFMAGLFAFGGILVAIFSVLSSTA